MLRKSALLVLPLVIVGCDRLPSSPPLDIKTAQLLRAVRRLADSEHMDDLEKVELILGSRFNVEEQPYDGADAHPGECSGRPTYTAHGLLRTYTPAPGFWYQRDPNREPEKYQAEIHFTVDLRTTCGGQHSGSGPEKSIKVDFSNTPSFTCILPDKLRTAIPGIKEQLMFHGNRAFSYKNSKYNTRVEFFYITRGWCLSSITIEQSDRMRVVKSEKVLSIY